MKKIHSTWHKSSNWPQAIAHEEMIKVFDENLFEKLFFRWNFRMKDIMNLSWKMWETENCLNEVLWYEVKGEVRKTEYEVQGEKLQL